MKALNQYTQSSFEIPYECIGVVVNNVDTEDRGRLQVRIYGIIDDSVSDIDCPWCETNGSIISSSSETIGLSSAPKIGSYVYVNFIYNNPSFPKVTGYVRGNKDSSLLHTVKGISSVVGARTEIGPELPSLSSSAVNPNNTVLETKSYTIELDDTDGNERVSIQHKSGSYFELRPDGTIQIKSSKDTYTITKGNLEDYIEDSVNRLIKGSVDETIEGVVNRLIKGYVVETIEGDVIRLVKGSLTDTIEGNVNNKINGSFNNETAGRTLKSPMTTYIGDLMVTGDVIIGGISFASDHISDSISGKSHVHVHGTPNTSTPLP